MASPLVNNGLTATYFDEPLIRGKASPELLDGTQGRADSCYSRLSFNVSHSVGLSATFWKSIRGLRVLPSPFTSQILYQLSCPLFKSLDPLVCFRCLAADMQTLFRFFLNCSGHLLASDSSLTSRVVISCAEVMEEKFTSLWRFILGRERASPTRLLQEYTWAGAFLGGNRATAGPIYRRCCANIAKTQISTICQQCPLFWRLSIVCFKKMAILFQIWAKQSYHLKLIPK